MTELNSNGTQKIRQILTRAALVANCYSLKMNNPVNMLMLIERERLRRESEKMYKDGLLKSSERLSDDEDSNGTILWDHDATMEQKTKYLQDADMIDSNDEVKFICDFRKLNVNKESMEETMKRFIVYDAQNDDSDSYEEPTMKRKRDYEGDEDIHPPKYRAVPNDAVNYISHDEVDFTVFEDEIDNMDWNSTPPTQPYESDDEVKEEVIVKNLPKIVLTRPSRMPLKDITVPKDDWEQSMKIASDSHVKAENRNKIIDLKKAQYIKKK